MSAWTKFRDAVESIAVVVGNYYLPGSSILTSKLVSEGAQEHLSSDLGVLAQLTSGIGGAAQGNMSNYGKVFGGSTGMAGSQGSGLATDTQSGLLGGARPTDMLAQDIAANPPIGASPANTPMPNTPMPNDEGMWSKMGSWLEKPGNVTGVGLGLQGAGAIMAGMGASEQAKVAKEKQDYERAQNERQLANINAPWVNPVRVNKRSGLLNRRIA